MADPQKFREFADFCARLANDAGEAGHQSQLMAMAEAWQQLAAEAERFEKMIQEMDQAFDTGVEQARLPRSSGGAR